MDHYPSDEEIAARITALLDDGQPRTDTEIAAALGLGAEGTDLVLELLESDLVPLVMPLGDGREVALPALFRGRVLTHRLTEEEVEGRLLTMTFDLAPLELLAEITHRTTSGVTFTAEDGAWRFTGPLWKHLGARSGDLVAVRLEDEEIAIELVDAPLGDGTALTARIEAAVQKARHPLDVSNVAWEILASTPDALTAPLPPLSELVDAAGLSRHSTYVGPAGADIDALQRAAAVASMAAEHDLETDEAEAVLTLVGLIVSATADGPAEEPAPDGALAETLAALTEPIVASALIAHTAPFGWRSPEALERLSAAWVEQAPRAARSNLWWVRGHALERAGRTVAAEEAFEKSLDLDGENPLALVDLSRYSADRGNLSRTLSLLRRAQMPEDHPTVRLLVSLSEPVGDIGRNDPCWCGSGRKYKNCHLHGGELPLDARALWLYERAAAFLPESRWSGRTYDLATIACDSDDPEHLAEHENDDLVVDTLLAEDGAFAGFLEQRGMLLPPADLALAQTWVDVRRGVYVVVGVSEDMFACVPHRDLPREPDPLIVVWPGAGEVLSVDDIVCTRLLPVGDTLRCLGGAVPVGAEEVAALHAVLDREHTAEEIVELLSWAD